MKKISLRISVYVKELQNARDFIKYFMKCLFIDVNRDYAIKEDKSINKPYLYYFTIKNQETEIIFHVFVINNTKEMYYSGWRENLIFIDKKLTEEAEDDEYIDVLRASVESWGLSKVSDENKDYFLINFDVIKDRLN